MKSYELQPTEENLIDTYIQDSIDRNKHLHYFIDILDSIEGCCSVAIDGRWGSGKTFFVKQAKMVLDSFNEHTNFLTDDARSVISDTWKRYHNFEIDRTLNPQVCVYYDAWQFDNDDDPLLSIMYEILNSVSVDYSFAKGKDCITILSNIAEVVSGRNLSGMIESLREKEDPLSEIKNSREISNMVNEFLDEVLSERGNRIVVFVDELDRCKPSYAVQLLERIKHYFCRDKVTFVFSINSLELQHTISQYYGMGFDSSRYLDRFFDLRISIPPANMQKYYSLISFEPSSHTCNRIAQAIVNKYGFELREMAKYLRTVKIALSKVINKETSYDFSFSEGQGKQFALLTLTPLLIGLKFYDLKLYNEFVSGKNHTPLLDIFLEPLYSEWFCATLLRAEETIEDGELAGKTLVRMSDKLISFYDALFNTTYDHITYKKRIGNITINAETQNFIRNTMSLLSNFADYTD